MPNSRDRRPAQSACRGDCAQIAADQRQGGAGHGDVGASAQGDADVGLRQGRRIVDAVPRHRDDQAPRLQVLDYRAFVVRQHLGADLRDANLPGDELGRLNIVAGRHDQFHAFAL